MNQLKTGRKALVIMSIAALVLLTGLCSLTVSAGDVINVGQENTQIVSAAQTIVDALSGTAYGVFKVVVAFVAFVIAMICGVKLVRSHGNPQEVKPATNGLIWAVIGGLVVYFAPQIVNAVFALFGTINLTGTE